MNGIAFKYAPIIYMDKREPVEIKRIGFTEYTENGSKSISFNRKFDFENIGGAVKVLEYAYYLDFDIQHLYDLEHIWVYLDVNDKVVGAEGSFDEHTILFVRVSLRRRPDNQGDFLVHDLAAGPVVG